MSASERHITIPAALGAIASAIDFVTAAAAQAGLDEAAAHHCALAVDEACTNIIEHGYPRGGADERITITCRLEAGGLTIVIEDSSPPFDPLSLPDRPAGTALLDGREGGWGVHFIRRMMDRVEYQRADGKNRLSLYKRGAAEATLRAETRPNTPEIAALTETIQLITPAPQRDSARLEALDVALRSLLDGGSRNLVIDLGAVERINTAGLKMLVGHWRRARDLKGDVVLAGVRHPVREAFAILGLDMVFTIVTAPRDAIPHFSKRR